MTLPIQCLPVYPTGQGMHAAAAIARHRVRRKDLIQKVQGRLVEKT